MTLRMFARLFVVLVAGIVLPACELVGDIFKAGMAVGVFLVFLFVAVVVFLISKVRSRV